MINVSGKWYDGKTSRSAAAVLQVFGNGSMCLKKVEDETLLLRQDRIQATISDRLADTPRFISFAIGGTFETSDNAAVDLILLQTQKGRWTLLVHALETRKRYISTAILLALVLGAIAVIYGIPQSAKAIAPILPHSVYTVAESQTLQILDKVVFKPSELDEETRSRIQNHFAPVMHAHSELRLTLEFRRGGGAGPNAFALPAGAIVFTDELVKISEHDDELLAIFVHEIGHVVERHAMRRVIQNSLLSFAIMALTGDASGVSELFMGLPVLLTESAYSRRFEHDADRYALNYLMQHHIAPHHFADILTRIETLDHNRRKHSGDKILSYIATHPQTAERIKPFVSSRRE